MVPVMSEEQLKAFLEAVKADADLQEQLNAAGDTDAVLAIAMAAGFVISVEELARAQAQLSEDELESLTGGTVIYSVNCSKVDAAGVWSCG